MFKVLIISSQVLQDIAILLEFYSRSWHAPSAKCCNFCDSAQDDHFPHSKIPAFSTHLQDQQMQAIH